MVLLFGRSLGPPSVAPGFLPRGLCYQGLKRVPYDEHRFPNTVLQLRLDSFMVLGAEGGTGVKCNLFVGAAKLLGKLPVLKKSSCAYRLHYLHA